MGDQDDGARAPAVTVVVPARNEESSIGPCLDSILAQGFQDVEILVVDGASEDATAEIVREYERRERRVRLISNPERVIPVGLNRAVEAARGRFLVRVDAHSTIPPDYVERVVGHLETGRWGGVGGRKDGVGVTPQGKAIAAAMASRFGVGGSTYHFGTEAQVVDHIPFGAYPLDVVRELGGWDERLLVNQDFEFDYRVRGSGRAILFDPSLSIAWECRQSIAALWRQYRRYGRGKTDVIGLHPDSAKPRHVAVPAYVAAVGLAAASSFVSRVPLVVLLSPYAAFLAVGTAAISRQVPAGSRRWVAPALVAMHFGSGVGFLEGMRAGFAMRSRKTDDRPMPGNSEDTDGSGIEAHGSVGAISRFASQRGSNGNRRVDD